MNRQKTTITLSRSTKERLEKLGQFGQTFDALINSLIDEVKK